MWEWLNYIIDDLLYMYGFSLLFGGFLVIPIFCCWFVAIYKLRKTRWFLLLWIPFVLLSLALTGYLGYNLYDSYRSFGSPPASSDSGPISQFPNFEISAVVIPMMLIQSSIISPFLLALSLASYPWHNKKRKPNKAEEPTPNPPSD